MEIADAAIAGRGLVDQSASLGQRHRRGQVAQSLGDEKVVLCGAGELECCARVDGARFDAVDVQLDAGEGDQRGRRSACVVQCGIEPVGIVGCALGLIEVLGHAAQKGASEQGLCTLRRGRLRPGEP